jgi:hypothetical protein
MEADLRDDLTATVDQARQSRTPDQQAGVEIAFDDSRREPSPTVVAPFGGERRSVSPLGALPVGGHDRAHRLARHRRHRQTLRRGSSPSKAA